MQVRSTFCCGVDEFHGVCEYPSHDPKEGAKECLKFILEQWAQRSAVYYTDNVMMADVKVVEDAVHGVNRPSCVREIEKLMLANKAGTMSFGKFHANHNSRNLIRVVTWHVDFGGARQWYKDTYNRLPPTTRRW